MVKNILSMFLAFASLAVMMGYFQMEDERMAEIEPSAWEGPVFEDGEWALEGIILSEPERKTISFDEVDLVQVCYGGGTFWAAVGIVNPDGSYESFVDGIETREELIEALQPPNHVFFHVPGTTEGVDWSGCEYNSSGYCHLVHIVENRTPPLLLDGDTEYTSGQSNVFVRSGYLPNHYWYGFLVWRVEIIDTK